MKSIALFILVLVSLTATSCWPTRDLKNYTLYGEFNEADLDRLKISGIFYTIQAKESNPYWNADHVRCFVLYNNGTYLDLLGREIDKDVKSAIDMLVVDFQSNKKRYSNEFIDRWGAFKITGDTLKIQRYHSLVMPKPGTITFTSKVFNDEMRILNDTSLSAINTAEPNKVSPGRKYYLYPTKSKPDSTNLFMTNKRIKRKLKRLYDKRHGND